MQNIEKNLRRVREDIQKSAQACHRNPEDITLLAVSKTKPASEIRHAYKLGQRDFGENYVQEAEKKILELSDLDINWHFIGPIQSNKTRKICELFDWVHSVDRLKIAHRLNEHRDSRSAPLNILLQVNIDSEASKSGISPEQVMSLAKQIQSLPNLSLRGLMAIPQPRDNERQQHIPLKAMFNLFNELRKIHPQCDTLSMGMSADMQVAIAEGSTLVRIGTAIFGARK